MDFFPASISNVILLCFSHSLLRGNVLFDVRFFRGPALSKYVVFLPCRPEQSVRGKGEREDKSYCSFLFFLIHVG